MPVVRTVWEAGCALGEGPLWLPQTQILQFVDIKSGRLLSYNPATGVHSVSEIGGKPSFVVPEQGGDLIIGSEQNVWRLLEGGLRVLVARIDQPDHNRTNDATVDSEGRLWFGTMDDDERQPTGSIYCLQRGVLHDMGISAVVTNGPAITDDGQTLYHVDSAERIIWRYRIGPGPTLEASEVFIRLGENEGYPDGVVLDSDGCLWVALWDGWAVRRYAPNGQLLQHVPMPCARVTKVAFGGPDLRTAFVTSARIGLSDAGLAEQPLAGSLFSFEVDIAGRPCPLVQLA